MSSILWILAMAGILVGAITLASVIVWKFRAGRLRRSEPDYKAFFSIGLAWTMLGAIFTLMDNTMAFFLPIGAVLLLLGLANRRKWGTTPPLYSGTRKRIMLAAVAGATALVAGTVIAALLLKG